MAVSDRIISGDMARAVGRFSPGGADGYRAATAPNAPLRKTRDEAIADEVRYLESRNDWRAVMGASEYEATQALKRLAYRGDLDAAIPTDEEIAQQQEAAIAAMEADPEFAAGVREMRSEIRDEDERWQRERDERYW